MKINNSNRLPGWTFGLLTVLVLALLTSGFSGFSALAAPIMAAPAQAAACSSYHTVKASDTLAVIAEKYAVQVADLTKMNRLYSPYFTIYVGKSLCIPAGSYGPSSLPKYTQYPAADFKADLKKGQLNIRTSNFPPNSFYFVKVTPPTGGKGDKIGRFPTAKGGTVTPSYKLDKKYLAFPQLTVCLKNLVTDANVCRVAKP